MRKSVLQKDRDIIIFFAIVFVIFWIRLFYIQIVDKSYSMDAQNNAFRNQVQYAARGLVYDRNHELLVYNEAVYDLMLTPSQVNIEDIPELCRIIDLDSALGMERYRKARTYSIYAASAFEKQLSKETYGRFQEHSYKFKGFYVQARTLRKYPQAMAAHVLGYIGEVDDRYMHNNPYYKMGDLVGMSGLEKQYEEYLRGSKGCKVIMVDVHNREKGSYKGGECDTSAIPGKNLHTSLDIKIQAYAEELMKNKRGSVVAIEPSSGEILVLVSSPTYDPNLLVGRVRSSNYAKLAADPSKPLFDRALMAFYPPGSIFKIPQALIALESGAIDINTGFSCDRSLLGCHDHPSAGNISDALKMSCNPYFYMTYRRMIRKGDITNRFKDSRLGLEDWVAAMKSFGFGQRLAVDLPNAKSGFIPNVEFYDKIYGKEQWAFSNIYSLSIGQGEVSLIPLQMANLAAVIANGGYYKVPHVVKQIGDGKEAILPPIDTAKHWVAVQSKYFPHIVKGMYGAVHEAGGTARRARVDSLMICGKTGTSQNPHGKDHAVFIAFAPMEDPKIAISVFVENSGFGGTWAAPIASLIIEKYIKGEVKRKELEKTILEANFSNSK